MIKKFLKILWENMKPDAVSSASLILKPLIYTALMLLLAVIFQLQSKLELWINLVGVIFIVEIMFQKKYNDLKKELRDAKIDAERFGEKNEPETDDRGKQGKRGHHPKLP
jgi:hypothetical protein